MLSSYHPTVFILDIVSTIVICLPDFDPSAGRQVTVGVSDRAFDPAGLSVAIPAMSPPSSTCKAPSTKNGPKAVASVAFLYGALLIAIVCIEAPSTSDSKIDYWRCPSVI